MLLMRANHHKTAVQGLSGPTMSVFCFFECVIYTIVVLTVSIPCDEVSETEVDIGIGLQQRYELTEGVTRKEFGHFSHVLEALSQEALPLSLILERLTHMTISIYWSFDLGEGRSQGGREGRKGGKGWGGEGGILTSSSTASSSISLSSSMLW